MARFTDHPIVELTTAIAAPPDRVWELVSDINVPAQFQDEFAGAEWLDPGPALGARFVGRNHRRGHDWETTSWVVQFEPGRVFGWAVSDRDNPGATWTFRLEPTATGTLLTFHRKLGPGPSGITNAIARDPDREEEIIARRDAEHRRHMQATIEGIRGLAEGNEIRPSG